MTGEPTTTAERVARADIDDVIAIAAKAKDAQEESLSVEELEQVALEIDLPAALIKPAVEELRRRRELVLASERAQAQTRVRRNRLVAGIAGGMVVALMSWGLLARAAVQAAWLEVDRCRAQVVNVLDRQVATQAQWARAPDSPDKHAELSGADNRVRVERKRYDDAVSSYRREASGLAGRVVVALGDYPRDPPLSAEIQGW